MDKEYLFKLEVLKFIIIHQTHYEKSDWPRAFNQFTIACELDMINAISAEDELCEKCIIKQLFEFGFCMIS